MRKEVVILIIAHKDYLSPQEVASLKQCYNILGKHPIKLICPKGLNVSAYKSVNNNPDIVFIDPKWQLSYRMFNELKKNQLLYKKFKKYKYILFYELDAWVFRDELEYWCNKGYDYIGAPWFEGFNKPKSNKMLGVGNGGFSLRNVKSAIRISRRIEFLKKVRNFWFKSHLQGVIRFETFVLHCSKYFKIHKIGNLGLVHLSHFSNEDWYWSQDIPTLFTDFKIAGNKEAMKFSFEVNPSALFEMNKYTLPFGCHAWRKHEPEFWKEFI